MPINAHPEYFKAEEEYRNANTPEEKIKALKEMLRQAPDHKGSEVLRKEIKTKLAKYKKLVEKEGAGRKGKTSKFSIKKEGDARICIIGAINTGKSTLLKKLTNARVLIADYPFTTVEPEVGIMDYCGIKLQMIEIPAIAENLSETQNGPSIISLIKTAALLILCFKNDDEKNRLKKEIKKLNINIRSIDCSQAEPDNIWKNLGIIKVYTKQPGKDRAYPPIAVRAGTVVGEFAEHIHKDFRDNFRFARIWGSSAKFDGQSVGLAHVLKDDDIVEFHIK